MAFQKESARRLEGKEALKAIDLEALAKGDLHPDSQALEEEGEVTPKPNLDKAFGKRPLGDDTRSEGSSGKRLRGGRAAPSSRSLDAVEDEFGAARGGGAGRERDTHLYSGLNQTELLEEDNFIPPGLVITE